MLNKLTVNLMVKDIAETLKFYTNILGFNLVMAVPESQDSMDTTIKDSTNYVWAQIKAGSVEIMLQETKSLISDVPAFSNRPIGASISLYIETENVNDLYNKIKDKVDIVKTLQISWYGMNEFYIRDNNGYILCFSQQHN